MDSNDTGAVAAAVLDFWFGSPEGPEFGRPRAVWFRRDPGFDAEIRSRFLADHELAAAGVYDGLAATPRGALALILMLDQFPRNLFRGAARAFACDPAARAVAARTVDSGWDRDMRPVERLFAYLPFEHSEDLADQDRCVDLMGTLGDAEWTRYAERHREIIRRFGRFPHRNAALGRETTAAERAFLKEPNSSF
ncbi:MAG: DUF924 family protein [Alphaproteobacteria bacterium]